MKIKERRNNWLRRSLIIYLDHEQPDVFPQPSQTKHDPAILIFTPHVIHSGASDFDPLIFSNNSMDEPTPADPTPATSAAGAFSILIS
jgi:hypothetical protein